MSHNLKVSDVNNYLKSLVENDLVLATLTVEGEISNFKKYSYGQQWYFTLKDNDSQISCVVFAGYHKNIKFEPKDGDQVVIKAKLAVFNRRGTYNLQVFWMEPIGLGDLAQKFEQLKQRLQVEGFFDQEHKMILPEYPKKVAVLAALEGAAVHDFIQVAKRRNSSVEILVVPTVVQGASAVSSIVHNISLVEQQSDIDIIVLARGGGSLEDLWAFNEEKVAQAIYNCTKPLVAAIGHEVDFSIADFVADLRAATPSVAAELILPSREDLLQRLSDMRQMLMRGLTSLVSDMYQQLDHLQEGLTRGVTSKLNNCRNELQVLVGQLESLNPLGVLQRGYSLVGKKGEAVVSVSMLQEGDIIDVRLVDGMLAAEVKGISHG